MLFLLFPFLALSDDEQSFIDNLYLENHRYFYNIVMGIVHSHEVAEEALQEAFLRIIRHSQKLLSLPCPERVPYSVVIVKHIACDILKTRKKITSIENIEAYQNTLESEQFTFHIEDADLLDRIFEHLTEDEQHLLYLKWVNGYQYREIAEILCSTEQAVNKRSSRLMKKVRELCCKKEVYDV